MRVPYLAAPALLALGVAGLVVGCSSSHSSTGAPPKVVTAKPYAGQPCMAGMSMPGCTSNASQVAGANGMPNCSPPTEVQQTSVGSIVQATGYGLDEVGLYSGKPAVGQELTVVWRVTGAGAPTMDLENDGTRTMVPLVKPSAVHTGAPLSDPGDEYSATYRFPSAGCYQFHTSRGQSSADVWLQVK